MKYDILIVDDEDIIIKLVRYLIVKSNLHVDPKAFLSAQDALDYLSTLGKNTTPQIVLLDINMPDLDGWDFLDLLIKSNYSEHVYVVIITSSINKSDRLRAEKYDIVAGYIEKPVSMNNMEEIKTLEKLDFLFAD